MALLSERTVTGIIARYLKLENIEPDEEDPKFLDLVSLE